VTKALRTYKLKITSDHPKFSQHAESYKEAANWLSNLVYSRKKVNTPSQLSKEFYGTVREKFNLPSQLTCSLFRHVVGTYRSMKSNKLESCGIQETQSASLLETGLQYKKKGNEYLGRTGFLQVAAITKRKVERLKAEVQQGTVVVVFDH
jgi:hypothetical protein